MVVDITGRVLEKKALQKRAETDVQQYEYLIFQAGQRDNIVVRSDDAAAKEEIMVRVHGNLSVNVYGKKAYVNVYAEQIEML
jgi:hypothetical protein